MKNSPQFSGWTKTVLNKFYYSWTKQRIYKNQYLHKEGEKVDKVYMIMSGEFEQFKVLK
jgi:hypothetical protein